MQMALHNRCLTVLASVLLSACSARPVVHSDGAEASLAPQEERITDAVIKADREYLAGVQARLQQLADAGTGTDGYHFCKAQAWLDMATNEYSENDRSGVIGAAAAQAVRLISAMENDQSSISLETPIIATASRVRPDLWKFVDSVRGLTTPDCASCELAYLEVQLVWIGHEQNELGWRHALPANQAADRLQRVVDKAGQCSVPPEPFAATEPTPAPVPVVPETVDEEAEADEPAPAARLPHFVHFAVDSVELAPASRPRITAIAEVLQERPDLAVRVEGYADQRGSVLYNLKLAKQRADSVRDAIVAQGISPARLSVVGIGETSPRAVGDRPLDYARNRRVELVVMNADAPVRLDLAEADLQPELD